tara:strand:- start:204 stop:389 length:186 start_codon:yes stop_codon:yes gene_type:complete
LLNNMKDTFNLTIKCDTEEKRDILLDLVCKHPELARCKPVSNVFFSENDGKHFCDAEREVI